jgi:ankyrin repeat protein
MIRWAVAMSTLGLLIICGFLAYLHWFKIRPLVEPRSVEVTHVQEPPLIQAAKSGDVAEIRRLISNGVNVNATDSSGFTALMSAVVDATDAVPDLLSAGANVNTKDNVEGATALTIACQRKNLQVIKALVNHGANVNAISKYGQTPLMTAAGTCSEPVVRYLLQNGAKVAEKSASGGTALFSAVVQGCVDVAKTLLQAGADVNVRTTDGHNLVELARSNHDARMVRLLKQSGAR